MDFLSISSVTMISPPEAKISLFRSLFRSREDVFARRFESRKTGKSGYQPMCGNEWLRGVCEKPRVRCASCPQRAFVPVSDRVVFWHLRGKDDSGQPFTMGVYPMLADETVSEEAAKARARYRALLVPVSPIASTEDPDHPWSLFSPVWTVESPQPDDGGAAVVSTPTGTGPRASVEVVIGNRVYVDATALPAPLVGRLVRLASFSNPEFFEAERMRLSVHGIPRVISCAQRGERFLALPRGCREAVLRVLSSNGFAAVERDERYGGVPLDVAFHGELRPAQRAAVIDLRRHDTGVLAAGTAWMPHLRTCSSGLRSA